MAPRRPAAHQPEPATLTVEEMRQGILRLRKRLEAVGNFEPKSVTEQFNIPHVEALTDFIDDALVRTFGAGSVEYTRYRDAASFDYEDALKYGFNVPIREFEASLARSKARSIVLLKLAITSLEERVVEASSTLILRTTSVPEDRSKIFVVHGHDEGTREAVARFLQSIGFQAIILHEQANAGRTVIEKVEAHGDVSFAVVLLTPDDEGCVKGGALGPRARQNVVLELGYFIGRLGRDRVCALKRGEVEIPSDFGGVVYETFDAGGGWKQALARELDAAGFEIDWNKVMRG